MHLIYISLLTVTRNVAIDFLGMFYYRNGCFNWIASVDKLYFPRGTRQIHKFYISDISLSFLFHKSEKNDNISCKNEDFGFHHGSFQSLLEIARFGAFSEF